MAKQGKITINYFLNKSVKFTLGRRYPLYLQVIVKRKNTKIKSRYNFFSKEVNKVENFTEEDFAAIQSNNHFLSDILKKESLFIEEIIRSSNPFESDSFTLAYFNEQYELFSRPIEELFEYSIKKWVEVIMQDSIKYSKIRKIIDWNSSLSDLRDGLMEFVPDDNDPYNLNINLAFLISQNVSEFFHNKEIYVFTYYTKQISNNFKSFLDKKYEASPKTAEALSLLVDGIIHQTFQKAALLSLGEKELADMSEGDSNEITRMIERIKRMI